MVDWSAEQYLVKVSKRKRAALAFLKLYNRLMTLHSGNCKDVKTYRRTLIRRLGVVLPYTDSTLKISEDGYLT